MQQEIARQAEEMNVGQQGLGEDNQLRMQRQQPAPHRQCPRCDSNNTKFCYYNNYSLSQPRYFCKACRRYWTHGGTLRNVPVGGKSRRGRRPRNPNSESSPSPPPQPQPSMTSVTPPPSTAEAGAVLTAAQSRMTDSYIPDGGGYVSSLGAMHPVNQPQGFQSLGFGGSNSNLGLLQGFNIPHAAQGYQMENRAKTFSAVYPFTSPDGFIQAGNNYIAGSSQPDWHQGNINSANSSSAWGTSNNATANNSNNTNDSIARGSSSFGAINHFPYIPGFGHQ